MRSSPLLAVPVLVLGALPAPAQNCSNVSVGFVPLNDLGDGQHKGETGGLYPGGRNHRPLFHDASGLAQASQVVPRNAQGQPDPDGSIVLLSIGMSNTSQEWTRFQQDAQADPAVNPALVIVNGAQGGQPIQAIVDPAAPYWDVVDQRLAQAGVTPAQVQAVWLKQAYSGPTDPFPLWAEAMRDDLITIVGTIRAEYPNARLLYASSRIYAGYATTALNPEPWAYESGFGVKWLIEEQIDGNPALAFTPGGGQPPQAPWMAWGPYLWADGLVPRSDGLVWECADLSADGTHPSPLGAQKVAGMLADFFETDATAKTWYLANPTPVCPNQALYLKYGPEHGGPNGAVQLTASTLPTVPSAQPFVAHAFGGPPLSNGAFVLGLAPLPVGTVPLFGGFLLVDPLQVFPRPTSPNGQANLDLGPIPLNLGWCGAEVFLQYGVADPDTPGGFDLSRGLRVRVGH